MSKQDRYDRHEFELLTPAECAEIFRLSTPETFVRFAKRWGIPLIRIGSKIIRISRTDLEEFIQRHRQE